MDPTTGPTTGPYDYDMLVIGGGAGGLAVAKVNVTLHRIFPDHSVSYSSLLYFLPSLSLVITKKPLHKLHILMFTPLYTTYNQY